MSNITIEKKTPVDLREIVKETDLRGITREPDKLFCLVTIHLGWASSGEVKVDWLKLGQVSLVRVGKTGWRLEAHLKDNACDFEHDTAYALKLPLIGLELDDLAIYYSRAHFVAWVHPDAAPGRSSSGDFHVPRAGYDPTKHADAIVCDGVYNEKKKKYCKWNDGEKHVIVPEGFYVPPFDRELYRAVRGKKVEIVIGAPWPEEA